MFIFATPDATKYPPGLTLTIDPSLEAETGADLVLSQMPIPPTANLGLHIKKRSLFVQIKKGHDITSYHQLLASIARMQKCGIPKGQAILLPIGVYYEKNGLLRVQGKKSHKGNTPYSTLGTIFDMWGMRGGTVEPLYPKHIDDLQEWIARKQASLEKITKEGKRDIFPPRPEFAPDDIWQSVEEIETGWPRFLVSGFEDCGSATVNSIFKYAKEETDENPYAAHHIFCLMTDEDKKGKPLHKIPLWGKVKRKRFREVLGLKDGRNLPELDYFWGWRNCLDTFEELVKKEKSLNRQNLSAIFEELKKGNEVPF